MSKNKKTQAKAKEMHKAYLEMMCKYGEMHEKYSPEALIKGGLFAALEGVIDCAPTKTDALNTIFSMLEMIMNSNAETEDQKIFRVQKEKIYEISKEVH
jgi:hypothetical protein